MAYNDMDVIAYKILSYLYECMKNGVPARAEDMCASAKLFRIPERYWRQIIEELQDEGLVKGFFIINTKDGRIVSMTDEARITLKGANYLEENSKMKEVGEFLGAGFREVLSTMIKAII
ncbi:MAG: YjcQ family protein [Bacillota bacterium]|nr:YjcQ family protein [Bacillota bacterium]